MYDWIGLAGRGLLAIVCLGVAIVVFADVLLPLLDARTRAKHNAALQFKSQQEMDRFYARVAAQKAVEDAEASHVPGTFCPQCWCDAEEDTFYLLDEPEGEPLFCGHHERELRLNLAALYEVPVYMAPQHDIRRAS